MKTGGKSAVFWLLLAVTVSLIFLLAVYKEFYFAADSGFLIRTGEYIYQNLKIPDRDIFSHTFDGRPWLLDRWAPCLFFFILYHFLGISGAILVKAGIVTAGFLILVIMLLREKRDPLVVFAAVILGALAVRSRFELRPQVISMLIFALQIYFTEQYLANRENRKVLVKLVVLLVIWANLHSEWIYGVLYFALILSLEAGEGIYVDIRRKAIDWEKWRNIFSLLCSWLIIVFLSFFTVYLINPNGFEVLLLPLKMAQSKYWQQIITELRPMYQIMGAHDKFFVYLGVLIVGMGCGYRQIVLKDVVLFFVFGTLAVRHGRAAQAFVLLTLPTLVRQWDYIVMIGRDKIEKKLKEPGKFIVAARTVFQLGLALCAGLLINFEVISKPEYSFGFGFDERFYPVNAFQFIRDKNLSGNYFNDPDTGGSMILFLYPRVRVFIDGRFMDLYDEEFYRDHFSHILFGRPDWEWQLDMYQVDYVLVRSIYDFGLKSVIERSRRWEKIYDDGDAWIYGRNN